MKYSELKPEDFEMLPKGDKITAKPLTQENRNDIKVYLFRDLGGNYNCLLQITNPTSKMPDIKGLTISVQNFGEPGEEMTSYIVMECRNRSYLENFTEIIKGILSDSDKTGDDICISVQRVISKWKYFLSEPRQEIMTEENIVGLIGELLFLEKLMPLYKSDSISLWTADRGEEDFIKERIVIEVKATIKERHEHVINGIDQLLLIPDRTKYILSLLFTKSDNDCAITLPALINNISGALFDSPESEDLFFKKLRSRGYDPRHIDLYHQIGFSLVKGGFFLVDEFFPKLTTEELIVSLSPRISKVRYLLDLEGLHNLSFAETNITTILS